MKNQRREPTIIITKAKNPNYKAVAEAIVQIALESFDTKTKKDTA